MIYLPTKLVYENYVKRSRANNVFTITKYTGIDPELGSQDISTNKGTTSRGIDGINRYPNVRIYSMGVDLTF